MRSTERHEAEMLRGESAYIGFLAPLTHPEVMETFARRKITAYAMELMTAAGTITPATVLVLVLGAVGLQAIATAHGLGARVEAFDARPAVREQTRSLYGDHIRADKEEGKDYEKRIIACL